MRPTAKPSGVILTGQTSLGSGWRRQSTLRWPIQTTGTERWKAVNTRSPACNASTSTSPDGVAMQVPVRKQARAVISVPEPKSGPKISGNTS
jgi:hypothetical protein